MFELMENTMDQMMGIFKYLGKKMPTDLGS